MPNVPERGSARRSTAAAQAAQLALLLVPYRPLALLAERRLLREKGESMGRSQKIL